MICPHSRAVIDRKFVNGYEFGFCDKGRYALFCRNTTFIDRLCDEAVKPGPSSDITYCKPHTGGVYYDQSYPEFGRLFGGMIPLFNFSRCGPIRADSLYTLVDLRICEDYKDQTNCTDPARSGLLCKIDGFISTVAKLVICNKKIGQRPTPICDDGVDLECNYLSESCLLHKHQMCDGISDCAGEIDEVSPLCSSLIDLPCTLKFGNKSVEKIPVQWVLDGISDCVGGEDEREDIPSCGRQKTLRYTSNVGSKSCSEVYLNLCTKESERQFVEFSELCDGKGSCGNELSVCRKSRRLHQTFTPTNTIGGVEYIHVCLPGLERLQTLMSSFCYRQKFTQPNHEILGRNVFPWLHLPTTEVDCRYIFGLMHVYLSCSGRCKSAACPLKNFVKYDSCQGQYPDRIYTLANSSYLTFLIKQSRTTGSNLYQNAIFPCENGHCVAHDKICNLENDCGDGSDEQGCSNHFQCESSGEFLTHDRVCDGVIDCMDHSDECNERCDKRMIRYLGLKIPAAIVGALAFLLNVFTILQKISTLKECKSRDSLANTAFLLLISCGDFLIGIYILIMIFHDLHHGDGYCKVQLKWLTSSTCSAIGILSTAGFLISVFSMTTLSLLRVRKIRGCLNNLKKHTGTKKRDVVYVSVLVLFVLTMAFSFAITPLINSLEDWFVNGIYYGEQNSLFIGTPGKSKHVEILAEYYGKLGKRTDLDWGIIRNLVSGMFSLDYSGIKYTKLQFYGNDAVCLFKFFVTVDNPQHSYVWLTIALNVLCICDASYLSLTSMSGK